MTPRDILQQYWGHPAFRPMQEEVIAEVMAGRDALAILPTGGGKSVCFQVPALALEGLCLVITPLVALMEDQLAQLSRKGIAAAALHAGLPPADIRRAIESAGKVPRQRTTLYGPAAGPSYDAAATKRRTLSGSLMPGLDSTPLETSRA